MELNPYTLDNSLLEEFQEVIHAHDDFLINRYRDYKGKNLWSLICSSKDWLQVSVGGLPFINLKHINEDARSLNLIQLIMAFDIVVQAIEQLYRVFERKHPLNDDHSIFRRPVTDNVYFKQIRACFAAHPVNLDSSDGEKDGKKYFASWSTNRGDCNSYETYLYSNSPEESAIRFSFQLVDIYEYVFKRYTLLADIIKIIETEQRQFAEELRLREIKRDEDPIKQLYILLEENKIRFCEGSGYHYEIESLIALYSAPRSFPNEEIAFYNHYLNSLLVVIEDIYQNLQSAKYDELPSAQLLRPHSHCFNDVSYDIGKLFEYINNPSYYSSLLDHHLKRLVNVGLLPNFARSDMDKRDLQLLLLAGMVEKGNIRDGH